jgi:uncharacterized protein YciI
MWYVILGTDAAEGLPKRLALRPAHLQRVALLRDAGRLRLAGPMPAIDSPDPGPAGFVGSLIVAEFESLVAAREWALADPYLSGGAWREVVVHPLNITF